MREQQGAGKIIQPEAEEPIKLTNEGTKQSIVDGRQAIGFGWSPREASTGGRGVVRAHIPQFLGA